MREARNRIQDEECSLLVRHMRAYGRANSLTVAMVASLAGLNYVPSSRTYSNVSTASIMAVSKLMGTDPERYILEKLSYSAELLVDVSKVLPEDLPALVSTVVACMRRHETAADTEG